MKKSWKKASAIFMAAALAAGLAGCGASNNNNTATTAAGKSAAESKVNGENSPEADNKKTDVTVILDYVANTNLNGIYIRMYLLIHFSRKKVVKSSIKSKHSCWNF